MHSKAILSHAVEEVCRIWCISSVEMILNRSVCMPAHILCIYDLEKMLLHTGKNKMVTLYVVPLPVGGSSEHHCEPGRWPQGLCLQELQPAAWDALALPGGLPAPALAGHPSHVGSTRVFPRVHLGKWSPPGQSHSERRAKGYQYNRPWPW